ncbi:glyoxalase superfamily protein [Fulvimarina manganoxydans]|uniref:glyoxalase superfamily protein n=1 Tax=Fulvimarina manganoxydans TaxID=937218 RepID=UPI002354D9AD|nr:glyoxalase superfamily protein [Fulvimarina manganoxydans]
MSLSQRSASQRSDPLRPAPVPLPSLDSLKDQARRLRGVLREEVVPVSYSHALEIVARQYGYRDWNTLHAAIGNRPPLAPLMPGSRVAGTYLGQAFAGRILSAGALQADPSRIKVTILFDDAVDVVRFESFSSFRRRVSATLDRTGRTVETTSDGRPHLELAW